MLSGMAAGLIQPRCPASLQVGLKSHLVMDALIVTEKGCCRPFGTVP